MTDRENSRMYCQQCTTSQLHGVIAAERDRMRGLSRQSEVYKAARILLQEARRELDNRERQ